MMSAVGSGTTHRPTMGGMERVRPPCRNAAEAHEAHGFHSHGYAFWNECPGWSHAEADTSALMDVLDSYARDHRLVPVDDGIRLECHPLVPYMLMRMTIPDFREFVAGENFAKPQIPVVVSAAMDRGAWRLVFGDRTLVSEGALRE